MSKLLAILIPALLVVIAVACGEDEEVTGTTTAPSSGSPTAPASGTPSVTPTLPASATATPTAAPTPTPTSNWQTYTNITLGFSFQYPPDWSLQEYATDSKVRIASFNLANWNGPNYPEGGVLVDIGRLPVSQAGPRPTDAVDATLGELSGWTRALPNTGEAPWQKSTVIGAVHGDYSYFVAAAFEAADADETVVHNIASTFALTK